MGRGGELVVTCVLAQPQGSSCTCSVVNPAGRVLPLTCCPVAYHAEGCCTLCSLRCCFCCFPQPPQPRALLNQVLLHCGDQRYRCALQRNSLQRVTKAFRFPIDAVSVRFC